MCFSIIIPFYNVNESYFEECLKSIYTQIEDSDEIIIVNDGSPYFPLFLLDKYKDERIRYYKQDNKGVSAARNAGIEEAQKPYIIFLDADDLLCQDTIKCFKSKILEQPDVDIVIAYYKNLSKGIYSSIDTEDYVEIPNKKELIISSINSIECIKNSCAGSTCAKAFRTSFLKENDLKFNESLRYSEDRLFMMHCYHAACKLSILHKYAYIYRIENLNSACHNYNDKIEEDMLAYFCQVDDFINTNYQKDKEVLEASYNMKVCSPSFVFRIKYGNLNKPKLSIHEDTMIFNKYLENINFYKHVRFRYLKLYGLKGKLSMLLIMFRQIQLLFMIRNIIFKCSKIKRF